MCNSLQPHGLQLSRFLCPWDSPGKNTGVGFHFLLQEISPTQGLNTGLLHCRQIPYHLSHKEPSTNLVAVFKSRTHVSMSCFGEMTRPLYAHVTESLDIGYPGKLITSAKVKQWVVIGKNQFHSKSAFINQGNFNLLQKICMYFQWHVA